MKHTLSLALCLLLFACGSVLAQAPAPTQRIRGDVVALDGLSLQVKSRSGETLAITLRPETRTKLEQLARAEGEGAARPVTVEEVAAAIVEQFLSSRPLPGP